MFPFKSVSPKLCEILQARLKAHRGTFVSNRPSPRALHLEFSKPPENQPPSLITGTAPLEHSVETFLEKVQTSDNEAGLTPVRPPQSQAQNLSVQDMVLPSGPIHTEVGILFTTLHVCRNTTRVHLVCLILNIPYFGMIQIVFRCFYFHMSSSLHPNVHTIHPKFYVILVIFNTI